MNCCLSYISSVSWRSVTWLSVFSWSGLSFPLSFIHIILILLARLISGINLSLHPPEYLLWTPVASCTYVCFSSKYFIDVICLYICSPLDLKVIEGSIKNVSLYPRHQVQGCAHCNHLIHFAELNFTLIMSFSLCLSLE